MNAVQIPPTRSPKRSTRATPQTISSQPNAWPAYAAAMVPRLRLFVTPQTMDRNTRPPSSGKPGIRLNAPRSRLVKARYPRTAAAALLPGRACPTAQNTAASSRLDRAQRRR